MDYTESVMDKILEQIKSETEITKEEKMEYLNSIFGEDIKKIVKDRQFTKEETETYIESLSVLDKFYIQPHPVKIEKKDNGVTFQQVEREAFDFEFIYNYLNPLMNYWEKKDKVLFYKIIFGEVPHQMDKK